MPSLTSIAIRANFGGEPIDIDELDALARQYVPYYAGYNYENGTLWIIFSDDIPEETFNTYQEFADTYAENKKAQRILQGKTKDESWIPTHPTPIIEG